MLFVVAITVCVVGLSLHDDQVGLPDRDLQDDFVTFDHVSDCLRSYGYLLEREMATSGTDQVYVECDLCPDLRSCLQRNSNNQYVVEFVMKLDKSMSFCDCFRDFFEYSTAMVTGDSDKENRTGPVSNKCGIFQELTECLQQHADNPFVRTAIVNLGHSVTMHCESDSVAASQPNYQDEAESYQRTNRDRDHEEKPDGKVEPQRGEEHVTVHTIPPPTPSPEAVRQSCHIIPHGNLDNDCASWMFNNYHVIKEGWVPCADLTYDYVKPCGHWVVKCRRNEKNSSCCNSVHCIGTTVHGLQLGK